MIYKHHLMSTASPIPYLASLAMRRDKEAKVVAKCIDTNAFKFLNPRLQRKVQRSMRRMVGQMTDTWLEGYDL